MAIPVPIRSFMLVVAASTSQLVPAAYPAERGVEREAAGMTIGASETAEQEFWTLIDRSALLSADPAAQLADLRASLDRLTPDRIVQFERVFDATMRRSYSWDLWGAAYLVNGGASDDGFAYFRCWLIAQGRRTFDLVVRDPDRLADILQPGIGGEVEFEELAYVAREAWAAKTGRDWNEMPFVADMAYDRPPSGSRFGETPAELAKRYPRLWARVGGR